MLVIAYVTVARTVVELAEHATPSVLDVEAAVDAIADGLPYEVAARLSHDDVRTIVRWQLDHFADVGLASELGEELAGAETVRVDGEAVADSDAAVDAVVARAMAESDLDAVGRRGRARRLHGSSRRHRRSGARPPTPTIPTPIDPTSRHRVWFHGRTKERRWSRSVANHLGRWRWLAARQARWTTW